MSIIFYVIWIIIPLFFFTVALWAKLEQMSKSRKKQNPGDFIRQGVFLSVCTILAIAINHYVIVPQKESFELIPMGLVQTLLYPLILIIGAKVIGGTDPLRVKRGGRARPRKR